MIDKQLPTTYPLYESSYGTDIPAEQLYVVFFNKIPSKFNNNLNYDPEIKNFLIEKGFKEISKINTSRKHDLNSDSLLVNETSQQMVRIRGGNDKKNNLVQADFIYNIQFAEFDFTEIQNFQRVKKKSSINLIKSEMGHLDTEEYDLIVPDMDLELNYGSEFIKVHDVIIDRLNKNNDKGIILLHGEPGTGKTSYIKYLTKLIKDKDILFIPPSMAEMLSEPSIIPFLMDQRNTVLIIEDAERVISDREGNGSPAGVSNILNLTDGILADCLNIQVIATFNMKRERIDQALLRKGRLIAEHKFEKLSTEETNKLLKHLGKSQEVNEAMSLADIYNIDVELFKSTNKNTSKIGLR
jgi:SpoVK/Ycf46/Vps4 family AAA+-type ATPase